MDGSESWRPNWWYFINCTRMYNDTHNIKIDFRDRKKNIFAQQNKLCGCVKGERTKKTHLNTQRNCQLPPVSHILFINFLYVRIGRFYSLMDVFQWHIVEEIHSESKYMLIHLVKIHRHWMEVYIMCVNFNNSINILWNLHAYTSLHFYSMRSSSLSLFILTNERRCCRRRRISEKSHKQQTMGNGLGHATN